ncbi:arabinosyltransferase domain-containing protein [Corynebacterium kroppenstedtii]|uniref:arabinosyltransferase domain-containing protein n=1 Tax=Corynebacterium sp. PCR 32 TaxID=3351342 RepID=UPI0030B1DD54
MNTDESKGSTPAPKQHRSQGPGTGSSIRRTTIVSAVTGIAAFILFILTPLMPVKQTQSSIDWPQNDNINSVVAPLMSYSPESLDFSIPLSLVTRLNKNQTDILSTLPHDSRFVSSRGLIVRATNDGVDVVNRSQVILQLTTTTLTSLPDDATLHVHSDATSTTIDVPGHHSKDGKALSASVAGDHRPQMTGIYTEISSTAKNTAITNGLKAHANIDSRFTSQPTTIKYIVMLTGLVLALISLTALWKLDKIGSRQQRPLLPPTWKKITTLDGIVGTVLTYWYFFGANTSDDGYLLTMARASHHSGYMANYYRWFGVPESPFGAPYYDLLGLMARVNTTSTWMRLPALIAAVLTWFLLSRCVIPRFGRDISQRKVPYWTAGFVFLAVWMAYNNGLRPEPVIALGALLTWVLLERAICTDQLTPAALGVIVASISLAAGPTGLMAVAALLAALSDIFRIVIHRLDALGAPRSANKKAVISGLIALLAPFLAVGTAILIAVFGDQTLSTVLQSIKLRGFIGPSLHWYEEWVRYDALFSATENGSFSRRLPIFMVALALCTVLAAMLRHKTVLGARPGPTQRLVIVVIGTAFFMAFTPTKWTHHFGVYAGVGAAVAALAAVSASQFAARSVRNRFLYLGVTIFLSALALAGTNGWWYISSLGVPWYDKPIAVKNTPVSSIMLVLALLIMAWGVIQSFRLDIQETLAQTNSESEAIESRERARAQRFASLTASPIAVLCALIVIFNCASIGKAFVKQYPAYSVGLGNIRTLAGKTCQMADYVDVEKHPSKNMLPTADDTEFKESLTADENHNFGANNIPAAIYPDIDFGTVDTVDTAAQQNNKNTPRTSTNGSSDTSHSDQDEQDSTTGTTSDADAANSRGSSHSGQKNTGSTGTEGGTQHARGINGSAASLPFGLDPKKVPVVGSYSSGIQLPAETKTSWYKLDKRTSPIIVVSAAGSIKHIDSNGVTQPGLDLVLEYGHRDSKGKVTNTGELLPIGPGREPMWRNLRFLTSDIPHDANVLRLHAKDTELARRDWLAFTPPRMPELESLNSYVGHNDPVLLEWETPLQFPCQRQYDHWAGVAELPKYRIAPSYKTQRANSPWMDYSGGGSLGLVETSTVSMALPTYFRDDWGRDWGELDALLPPANSTKKEVDTAKVAQKTETRSGLWNPGPMNYKDQGLSSDH